jgi:hypothetical protein
MVAVDIEVVDIEVVDTEAVDIPEAMGEVITDMAAATIVGQLG